MRPADKEDLSMPAFSTLSSIGRSLFGHLASKMSRRQSHRLLRPSTRLNFESLEDRTVPSAVRDIFGSVPLSFEANDGQADAQVQFLARGPGYGLFLTGTEAMLSLQR